MNTFKQTLCRLLACRVRVWLATGLLMLLLAPPLKAQPARAPAAGAAGVPASPALEPEPSLLLSVRQWVALQRSLRPEQVQLAPLDARLKVQPCTQALAMDLPMASADTIRVRCPDPVWQLYLRVQAILPLPGGPAPERPAFASASPAQPLTPAQTPVQAQAAVQRDIRRPVVVAAQGLVRGMTLQSSDVRLQEMVLPPTAGTYMDQIAEVMHSEVLRDVPAGTPVRRSDLRPLVLVKRGQQVQLQIGKNTGFVISARVEAMQDGRLGEPIKLKNNESGRMLSGVVRGPGLVEGN